MHRRGGRRSKDNAAVTVRTVDFLNLLRAYVEALVHPSARADRGAFARHFFFIATRLAIGLLAFAALPVFLATRGVLSFAEAVAYCWFLLPLFLALYASRTGAFERAHVFSAMTFAVPLGLFAGVAGPAPFVLWAVLLPIEAVLFCSRAGTIAASLSALAAFAIAWSVAAFALPPALARGAPPCRRPR